MIRRARALEAFLDTRMAQSRRAFYMDHPRADQPWTRAEERRLQRLMPARRAARQDDFNRAAHALGRTDNAVRARWAELTRCRMRQHNNRRTTP
jgi:hypothetical protein